MTRTILSIIFLSSFTISIFAMHSITVDGKNIEGPLRPGQVLVYKHDKNNVLFIIQNNEIKFGSWRFSLNDIEGMRRDYNTRKDMLSKVDLGKGSELSTGNFGTINTRHVVGSEYINLSAGSELRIVDSLFESKAINASCCKFHALSEIGTFIVANSFTIKSKLPNSPIKSIRFILSPAISDFAFVEGTVNFECDKNEKQFLVYGSQEAYIEFASESLEQSASLS